MNKITEKEIDYIKNNYPLKTSKQIAVELNVGSGTINWHLRKLGIKNVYGERAKELNELKNNNLSKCRDCHQILPRTNEFFYESGKSFHTICRKCQYIKEVEKYNKRYKSIEKYANAFIKHKLGNPHGKICAIVPEDIINQFNKQNGLCFYTKEKLMLEPNKTHTISVDRIDSSFGYIKGNIVLCCKAVNMMKQEFSIKDFVAWCQRVVSNQ